MSYSAIIFDLDGTLLNTLEDLADSTNYMLAQVAMPTHPLDAYRYFVGEGARNLVKRALPELHRSDTFIDHCLELFLAHYQTNCDNKTHPYAGITALLHELAQRNLPMAVLTNKPHDAAKMCMDTYFSKELFSIILGHGTTQNLPRKPDPSSALYIAKKMSREPSEILFVGDTAIDMKTAMAAGMTPIGVLWGFRTKEELQKNGAQEILQTPSDLLSFVK